MITRPINVVLSISLVFGMSCNSKGQSEPSKLKLFQPISYDERKVPAYTLPDVLRSADGTIVSSVKQWEEKRRPELLEFFSTYMFGKVPEITEVSSLGTVVTTENALNGKAIRKDILIYPLGNHREFQINLQIYLPKTAPKNPVPIFLAMNIYPNFVVCEDAEIDRPDSMLIANGKLTKSCERGKMSNFWQLEKILDRGYGLATFGYQDIVLDDAEAFYNGFPSLFYKPGQRFPNPDEWGAISLWAWQMSKVMDYIMSDSMIDNKEVIAIGHSRLGKTALWAAAQDKRFAMAISSGSGCGGAAISRRQYGETIEAINQRYPHWFCGNFKQFDNREQFMPFDQHELIALIAPRPVYIGCAEDEKWEDPKGEFLSGKEASVVYHLYGLTGLECDEMPPVDHPIASGNIGYHVRKGKHTMNEYDWEQYLNFADYHFQK